jgi:glucosylceramidase
LKAFFCSFCLVLVCVSALQAGEVVISLNASNTYQEIEGFGAGVTESSAWLLYKSMSGADRTNLMEELFSPDTGIGLSYVRIPMGASDFRLEDYTYDDMTPGQTDFDLSEFSVAHDDDAVVPMLQAASMINTNLRIMGTPWSPPAWMKTTTNLYYGELRDDAYDALARYFLNFVQAYSNRALTIDAITLQNEPLFEPYTYGGMSMTPSNQARLAELVGEHFSTGGVSSKIIVYDHNWDQFNFPLAVLSDTNARPYIDGTAFHGYCGDVNVQSLVHDAYPDKGIYFTEFTLGEWSSGFSQDLIWEAETMLVGGLRNWAKTIIMWNVALDQNFGPKMPGGCEECHGIVTVNTNTWSITRHADYYVLAHAAKFVKQGAYRIQTDHENGVTPCSVGFVNPDDTLAVIAYNAETTDENFVLRWNGESCSYVLPARSLVTLTWSNTPGAEVDVCVTTSDQSKLLAETAAAAQFSPLTLSWKGYTWAVRDSEGQPGANDWAANCAWIDTNDDLHLTVRTNGAAWYCGQVETEQSLGFGTYRWQMVVNPSQLNTNLVAALGTVGDPAHGLGIDYTRAYADAPTNMRFAVEPYYEAGHEQYATESFTGDVLTCEVQWNPRQARFRTWYGHTDAPETGALVSDWTYEGDDVPNDTNEVVRMALWMYDTVPPDQDTEWIFTDFNYIASTGTVVSDAFEDGTLSGAWTSFFGSGGQVTESSGVLQCDAGSVDDDQAGCVLTAGVARADNGLTLAMHALLSTVRVDTACSAGGADLWGWQGLFSTETDNPYDAQAAAWVAAGYDASADTLTVSLYTKTNTSAAWGTLRYAGIISNAAGFFGGGGLDIELDLVYGGYAVQVLYSGGPVAMSTVSGSSTGAHALGTALTEGRYGLGARNNGDGRGEVHWGQVDVASLGELESTAGVEQDNGAGEKVIQVGEADHWTTWRAPIDTRYTRHRSQILYKSELIDRSGSITQLQLYVLAPPDITMSGYTIRMQHSDLEALSESFINSGWTTVYQHDVSIPSDVRGWYAFNLDTPFDYNMASNLLIDFIFENSGTDDDPLPTTSYTLADYNCAMVASASKDSPFTWTGWPKGRKFKHYGTRMIDVRLVFPDAPPEGVGQNLSFEDGSLGFITNVPSWEIEGSVYGGAVKSTPVVHKLQALKLWKGTSGNGDQKLFQYFPVSISNRYVLGGYVLTQGSDPFGGTGAYGCYQFEWYGADGLLGRSSSAHFTSNDAHDAWRYLCVTSTPPPNTTSGRITCALFSSADQQGSLFYDHLSLDALSTTVSNTPASNTWPVAGSLLIRDEFNDGTQSNIWQVFAAWDEAINTESNGMYHIRPGTSLWHTTGYVSTQTVSWSDTTNTWMVFSAVLSTVRVDVARTGEDMDCVLGVSCLPDNPWWVTNSVSLYGHYDVDADTMRMRFLTKTNMPANNGTDRYGGTILGVSDYLSATNALHFSIALGHDSYQVRICDSTGSPVPLDSPYGSAWDTHNLGDTLYDGYWVVAAQNDYDGRGRVSWDRTEVFTTLAPTCLLDAASQVTTNGEGYVLVTGAVYDANGDVCTLETEISTNNGASWFRGYVGSVQSDFGAVTAGTADRRTVLDAITTNGMGELAWNTLSMRWDTQSGYNQTSLDGRHLSNVWVRFSVCDGAIAGAGATVVVAVVDNEAPAAGAAGVTVNNGAGYTMAEPLQAAWSNFSDGSALAGYYAAFNDGGGGTDGTWSVAETLDLSGVTWNATNEVFVWCRDAYGNIGVAVKDDILVLSEAGDWDADGLVNSGETTFGTSPLNRDSDGDDINDGWETLYSMTPTNPVDGDGDADSDGYSNRDEFYFDTDPNSFTSTVCFAPAPASGADEWLIEWNSSTGRVYSLYGCASIGDAWQPLDGLTNMPGVGGTMVRTDRNVNVSCRMYKLKASVAP